MQQLKKIDAHTNVLTWFEIPVTDLDRARIFYETILDIEMIEREDNGDKGIFFPFDPNVIQASSGRVTGVLAKSSGNQPSANGTLIYLNASPMIQDVLDRVVQAGGSIVSGKFKIPAGYIAVIGDTEGNRLGLYAAQ